MTDFKEGSNDSENNENNLIEKQSNDTVLESSTSETLKVENRIMVCGTRGDGVIELAERAKEFLIENNIPESSVVISREVTQMERNFYGVMPKHISTYYDSKDEKDDIEKDNATSLTRIRNKFRKREKATQKEIVCEEESSPVPTLPRGVLVLPYMRQHDPWTFTGMTIPTPYEDIKKLCDKHNVPMVIIPEKSTHKDPITDGIIKLLSEESDN